MPRSVLSWDMEERHPYRWCGRSMTALRQDDPGQFSPQTTKEGSGHDGFDHFTVYVCEAEVAACVAECQFLVIQAEEGEDGGVEVVDLGFVLDGFVTVVVTLAIAEAAADAAARHPQREGFVVVIASVAALSVRGAA